MIKTERPATRESTRDQNRHENRFYSWTPTSRTSEKEQNLRNLSEKSRLTLQTSLWRWREGKPYLVRVISRFERGFDNSKLYLKTPRQAGSDRSNAFLYKQTMLIFAFIRQIQIPDGIKHRASTVTRRQGKASMIRPSQSKSRAEQLKMLHTKFNTDLSWVRLSWGAPVNQAWLTAWEIDHYIFAKEWERGLNKCNQFK